MLAWLASRQARAVIGPSLVRSLRRSSTVAAVLGRVRKFMQPSPAAPVLVKIGSGLDSSCTIAVDELQHMNRMELLRALMNDVGFATVLKGEPLDRCRVFVLQTVAGSVPTAKEESATRELVGAGTIGELLPPCPNVIFLRVRLSSGLDIALKSFLDLSAFSNVLARGPDDALDLRLLSALGAADTDSHERVLALSSLVDDVVRRDPGALYGAEALPLFDTLAHASLLEILIDHARLLVQGAFKGSNGSACRTLVGPRGIGKTVMLRAFATIAASAFPSLIVVYISGEGVKQSMSNNSFRSSDVSAVIEAAARVCGAETSAHRGPFALESALRSSRSRVLLILDEIEELYRVSDSDGVAISHVLSSLGALQVIAGGTTGLFGVLACGSSASTHALIRADVTHLIDKFPLIRAGVPDLNDTKFRQLSIKTAPCTRSAEVAAIIAGSASRTALPDDLLPLSRLLTFIVGVTPRAVIAAIVPGEISHFTGAHLSFLSFPRVMLSESARVLCDELFVRLGKANKDLCVLTRAHDGSANIEALMDASCEWEGAVTPLLWRDVEEAWAECATTNGLDFARDGYYLARLVSEQGRWE